MYASKFRVYIVMINTLRLATNPNRPLFAPPSRHALINACGELFFIFIFRCIPQSLRKELLGICYLNVSKKLDQLLENHAKNADIDDVVIRMLSKSLLRIIPNIILNKREEVIPLLVMTIYLNQDTSDRDKLLQQLFNLKKKPTDEERAEILIGIVTVARWSGESAVENEILPLCWEQLTHKHMERRLLVVETCNALIPYVSVSYFISDF